jgi:hypothetical protein
MKERAKLRNNDPIILLPSGEATAVRIAGKNTFAARARATPLLVRDEYDPIDNPEGSWCRPENKPDLNIELQNDIVEKPSTEEMTNESTEDHQTPVSETR